MVTYSHSSRQRGVTDGYSECSRCGGNGQLQAAHCKRVPKVCNRASNVRLNCFVCRLVRPIHVILRYKSHRFQITCVKCKAWMMVKKNCTRHRRTIHTQD